MPEFRPDNLIDDPSQLGGQEQKVDFQVEIPIQELPSIWKRMKQWYENWRKSH